MAVALAERRAVSLISMDSAMVYRGMDIGTAKPSAALRARHPHALVDIRDPAEPYSAAEFVGDADRAVREALAAGKVPVLVGGTMLYLRAFREGLAALPPADRALRETLDEEARERGWPAMHDALRRVDPAAAAGIHPHNRVRIQRALEVHRLTATPLSEWWSRQARTGAAARLGARLLEVALLPDSREALAALIERRLRAMLDAGLIDEVAGLKARGDLSLSLPSMRSVGYRQTWEYLTDGDDDREALVASIAAATRRLAKRQLTWLKSWEHVVPLSGETPAARADRLLTLTGSA